MEVHAQVQTLNITRDFCDLTSWKSELNKIICRFSAYCWWKNPGSDWFRLQYLKKCQKYQWYQKTKRPVTAKSNESIPILGSFWANCGQFRKSNLTRNLTLPLYKIRIYQTKLMWQFLENCNIDGITDRQTRI